jgi:type I restriction enzyme S subunit
MELRPVSTSRKAEWHEVTVEDLKASTENALATGPFGSSIGSRFFLKQGIPVIRGGNLSNDGSTQLIDDGFVFVSEAKATECRRSIVIKGDLIFTCWGTINQVGLIGEGSSYSRYIISNKQMKFTPDANRADSLFLYYLFSGPALQRLIVDQSIGSSVPGFNLGQLRTIRLRIPPLPEQRAIAGALSDVDGLIRGLDKLIAKKRDLKQAAMQQLLTGKLRLPGFTGEWEVKRLGSLLKFQVGFPFSSTFFDQKNPGVRLIKNRDLKSDDQIFHYWGEYEKTYLVFDGDVLVGMDGDFMPCIWRKGPALLNQRVGRILPSLGMDRTFAYYFLIEPLKAIEIGTSSTTVKHLSHGDIEDIEQPVPSFDEQTIIAAVLSDMDAEIAALEDRRDKTRDLKQGMMQELLTGRIRLV